MRQSCRSTRQIVGVIKLLQGKQDVAPFNPTRRHCGKPYSREEKELIVKLVRSRGPQMQIHLATLAQDARVPLRTIKKILKELKVKGSLSSNRNPHKNRRRIFDKLTSLQKDQIRMRVHDLFKAVSNKGPEAVFPTLKSNSGQTSRNQQSASIQNYNSTQNPQLPWFFPFQGTQKSKGSLHTDRESLVAWRKKHLQALLEARRSGTPVYYLDESYCHQYHCKQKTWRDATVCSKQDAVGRGLTTGIKTPASMRRKEDNHPTLWQ